MLPLFYDDSQNKKNIHGEPSMKKNAPNDLGNDNALIDIDLQVFIDNMHFPIILLDQTGTIKTVNTEARILFKKELLYFKGKSPGKVFECKNAYSPG